MSRRNSLGAEQKTRHLRVGPRPDDVVQVDETVRVPQNIINGTEFKGIDFGNGNKAVLGWRKALN